MLKMLPFWRLVSFLAQEHSTRWPTHTHTHTHTQIIKNCAIRCARYGNSHLGSDMCILWPMAKFRIGSTSTIQGWQSFPMTLSSLTLLTSQPSAVLPSRVIFIEFLVLLKSSSISMTMWCSAIRYLRVWVSSTSHHKSPSSNEDKLCGQAWIVVWCAVIAVMWQIWPGDFYTRFRGHKVFLTWDVPTCAPGCADSWISDGYCDPSCNVAACDFDGGDCNGTSSRFSGWSQRSQSSSSQSSASPTSRYCSYGCPNTWIGDKVCDRACKNAACGFDGGDCGLEIMVQNMIGIDLTPEVTQVKVLMSVYVW